jgi:hypothetical protein
MIVNGAAPIAAAEGVVDMLFDTEVEEDKEGNGGIEAAAAAALCASIANAFIVPLAVGPPAVLAVAFAAEAEAEAEAVAEAEAGAILVPSWKQLVGVNANDDDDDDDDGVEN